MKQKLHPCALVVLHLICNFTYKFCAFTEEPSDKTAELDGLTKPPGPRKVSREFRLKVQGNPEQYQPGVTYAVTLYAPGSFFCGFTLASLKDGTEGLKRDDYTGSFQVMDEVGARLMSTCPHAVIEHSPRRRTKVQVFWTAPPPGSGCVILKACATQNGPNNVKEKRFASKRICEKAGQTWGGVSARHVKQCCACGMAMYRLTFYGNWSEDTHPKHYPRHGSHWSDIIGASHSWRYVLWRYGSYASEGIRQLAELGSPLKLEEEIRQKGDEILTVIKAKAQWPAWRPLSVRPAVSADFLVDRAHHLVSFLSMLGPSPDWAAGLSTEDLCTLECGWVQRLVKDLQPWDAGTHSGVSYETPSQPTVPQERVRPLTSLENPQGPFYDPTGHPVMPVARVVLERIARKGEKCSIVPDNVNDVLADIGQKSHKGATHQSSCSTCRSSKCEKGRHVRRRASKAWPHAGLSRVRQHTGAGVDCCGEARDKRLECWLSCGRSPVTQKWDIVGQWRFGGNGAWGGSEHRGRRHQARDKQNSCTTERGDA